MIVDNAASSSSSLASNCPGVSSTSTCQPYKYINVLYNYCNTGPTLAAYKYADSSDEGGFIHNYPGAKTKANRLTYLGTPNPTGPHCKPDNANAVMRMDPGNSQLNTWLYNNVWNGSSYTNDFPAPYGILEDQADVFAWIYVSAPGKVSTEYGSGTSRTGFADLLGNSSYRDDTDYETALGRFADGACAARCINMSMNGVATGAGNLSGCSIIGNGHCHAPGSSGMIDDQAAIDNVCAAATHGNLKYFPAERPVFAGRSGNGFLDSQTTTVGINTNANLYSHTSGGCANTKIIDIETSYGTGGPGDVTGGYRVRLETLAWRWLVANPATGRPDRVISQQYTERGTSTEIPYFFEDTLVPYEPEVSVPKFVWNGRVQTVGGGCPSRNGDSGGAVAVLSQCVGSSGIFCQQYEHLYTDGTDHGKVAVCLNTSTSTVHVASSWFKHDPISSYHYMLALKGGEMTSVPYQGVSGGSIQLPCTNRTYCTGSNSLSAQTARFAPGYALCGPCGLVLLENN